MRRVRHCWTFSSTPPSPDPSAGRSSCRGAVMPRFSLISLPPEETPGLDCFICAHLTPELMRRPDWLVHPNGAAGVKSIHVLVENTMPLLPAYDRLFGIQQVTTTDTVVSIRVGRHRIVFCTPDDFA